MILIKVAIMLHSGEQGAHHNTQWRWNTRYLLPWENGCRGPDSIHELKLAHPS